MQLIIYILILLATIEFNKQLIDNVGYNPKEQREWHIAQFAQWVIIYSSIAFLTKDFITLIGFAGIYPLTYDTLLNWRRGLKQDHEGVHDVPKLVKYIFFVIGLITLIGNFLG